MPLADFDAITFDCYGTLIRLRTGVGRGRALMTYLSEQGLKSDPWEHQVLYDVFEAHAKEYSPDFPEEEKQQYLRRFVERVFRRLGVRASDGEAADHAQSVWTLLGPVSFSVFTEVPGVLRTLKAAGYRLAVVSNWQCGLGHFCTELGLGDAFDDVVASAEVGSSKPDPAIFHEACRRLGVHCGRVLHVGDSLEDDFEGARRAGLQAVLLQRDREPRTLKATTIRSLAELEPGRFSLRDLAATDRNVKGP